MHIAYAKYADITRARTFLKKKKHEEKTVASSCDATVCCFFCGNFTIIPNEIQGKSRYIHTEKSMNYTPPHQKKQVRTVVGVLFALAAVTYVFSLMQITSPMILQLVSVILLCAGTYILVRYRYTTVSYSIRPRSTHSADEYGDDINVLPPFMVDFAVTRAQGQRSGNLEVLISLDKLVYATDVKEGILDNIRNRFSGVKTYVYTMSLADGKKFALVFDDDGDKSCVVIEPSGEMREYLMTICEKNRSNGE